MVKVYLFSCKKCKTKAYENIPEQVSENEECATGYISPKNVTSWCFKLRFPEYVKGSSPDAGTTIK